MPDFSRYDLSGRKPRQVQVDCLNWLDKNWQEADVFVINAPVASGKSLISKSISVATGADIIASSNLLLQQYAAEYKRTNALKGKATYVCTSSGISCADWQGPCGQDPCAECPYTVAKNRAIAGEPTVYNAASLFYLKQSTRIETNQTLVVDEAHLLPGMLTMMASKRLRLSEYKFSAKCTSEVYLSQWLAQQIDRLDRLAQLYQKRGDAEKIAATKKEIESLGHTKQGLDADGQNYVLFLTKDRRDTYLHIQALFPPRFLVDKLLANKKLILMSGSMFAHDIKALVGERPYLTLDLPSPIPVENRTIHYKPAPFKINFETDPKKLSAYIEAVLDEYDPLGALNTIIHSTYALTDRLVKHFNRPIIYNGKDDKDAVLQEFKRNGGTLLGSGMAEGIDLKDDLARVNVIPKLLFPNLGDPAVLRRKALQDGQQWYALTTLQNVIQQAGRSTRHPEDHSAIMILDPNFKRLFNQYKHLLPSSFVNSVVGV